LYYIDAIATFMHAQLLQYKQLYWVSTTCRYYFSWIFFLYCNKFL